MSYTTAARPRDWMVLTGSRISQVVHYGTRVDVELLAGRARARGDEVLEGPRECTTREKASAGGTTLGERLRQQGGRGGGRGFELGGDDD